VAVEPRKRRGREGIGREERRIVNLI